ncbi:methyltransferase [Gemmatimonadetes bacterium T265]|nr:methyltransferase [Gemmatimonadetes bacterium T265]
MSAPRIYYSDRAIELWHGDALRVLDALVPASVDALITDPPYSSGGFTRGDRVLEVHTKYVTSGTVQGGRGAAAFAGDNRDARSYLAWCTLWLGAALPALKPGGLVALFTDWRQLPATIDALQTGGFVWRGIVPWYKRDARPQRGRFTNACEYVVWGTAGARPLEGAVYPGFYDITTPRAAVREHITEKPIALMRALLAPVPHEGRVLDPFVGSGTTLDAAKQLGLQAVGCELVEDFCAVTARRLAEGSKATRAAGTRDLFAEPAA